MKEEFLNVFYQHFIKMLVECLKRKNDPNYCKDASPKINGIAEGAKEGENKDKPGEKEETKEKEKEKEEKEETKEETKKDQTSQETTPDKDKTPKKEGEKGTGVEGGSGEGGEHRYHFFPFSSPLYCLPQIPSLSLLSPDTFSPILYRFSAFLRLLYL